MSVDRGQMEIASSFYDPSDGCTFKTSLEVIQKVMNVPFCALESILRQHKKKIVERTSICIDEKMLEVFADAYVRKMKNYFRNSTRHVGLLSLEEKEVLNSFCKHFKKGNHHVNRFGTWEDIDEALIREAFYAEVKEATPQQDDEFKKVNNQSSRHQRFIEAITASLKSEMIEERLSHYSEEKITKALSCCNEDNRHILKKVTKEEKYQSRYVICSRVQKDYPKVINSLRFLFVSARYRMYSADDKEDCDMNYNVIVSDDYLSRKLKHYNCVSNSYMR